MVAEASTDTMAIRQCTSSDNLDDRGTGERVNRVSSGSIERIIDTDETRCNDGMLQVTTWAVPQRKR